ncbi:uncharacterized protein TNCV_306871 [Trichonephila clavipes]|nr:uncharacterized protein TNCV_306871 [Trichonephila clavipes]
MDQGTGEILKSSKFAENVLCRSPNIGTRKDQPGIKRAIPSSVSSRNYKYRRPNNPFQGSQPITGPSHQQDSRQDKSPTVASRHEGSGQYNKARETKTTKNGTNRAAERRTVCLIR